MAASRRAIASLRSRQSHEYEAAVRARFVAVNGDHPMTPEDDAYASRLYVSVEDVAKAEGVDPSEIRRLMLANRLPLPSYIRSDGTQMVPRDLFALAARAGGIEALPSWFARQFDEVAGAVSEWDSYLSGQYVCLYSVTPENIKRKDQLTSAISELLDEHEAPKSREKLEALVNELDALEPPFTSYDRLRFGGPMSRDRLIDDVRDRLADAAPDAGKTESQAATPIPC